MTELRFNTALPKRGNKWGINCQGFDAEGNQWMIDGRDAVLDPSNARRVSTEGTLTKWAKLPGGGFADPVEIGAQISWDTENGYHSEISVLAVGNGQTIALNSDEATKIELPVEKSVDMVGAIL